MARDDKAPEALRVNAFAMHRAEVLMMQRRQLRPRHKTLVSFAAKYHYVESQRRLVAAAAATGDFDTIESWSPDRLRGTSFYRQHTEILDRSRGAGNWAWKPYIIAQALEARRDGDFLVFSDTGMQAVGDDPLPPIAPLLTWLSESGRRVAVGVLHGRPQRVWTKRDCFVLMDCDTERYWNVDQIQASWIAFMVGPETRHLVAEWLRYASDARVVTDIPNQLGLPDLEGFIDHRFDQSILSNLIYKLDLEIPALREPSKRIRTLVDELERDALVWARPSENLALGKTWTASSASPWSGTTGIYGERTTGDPSFFFHTGLDRNPWFVLDLGTVERVAELRIYNRWGQPSERAQLMRVWLSETGQDYRLVFDAVDAHCHPGLPLHLRFDNACFRYLKVDLDEEQYLHLDGVEIFAAH
ncbi:discoidin domain-containing protein [Methylobacterium sp. WL18]|uniref:discoidin domain-containing protein n=1 Tax=Methylobacterium sp. WL18 TaxID=2603897 RepID=UPI0011C9CEA3|nr:discoidin domain-containing protein [Methylobacterium sp. WL18]TXN75960.1 discoidin domain-containing protein [Methylobacterium sp. WL18]